MISSTATDANGNVNSLLHSPTQHDAQDITARHATGAHATEALNDAEVSVAAAGTGSANTNTGMVTLGSSPQEATEKDKLAHLSFAPIKEVINIADEVPDSASQLDYDEDDDLEADDGDFPLFSHECFSSASDSSGPSLKEPGLQDQNHDHSSEKSVPSNTNYDDPTLEPFPSDRNSIIATMRRLSATLDVDPTMLNVIPLSAITTSEPSFAGAPSPKLGFLGAGDPTAAHRQAEEVSQQPASILSPSRSLESIAEAEEAPDGNATCAHAQDADAPAQRIGPVGARKLSLASAGSSGEDEGIAMAIAPRKRMREATRMKAANDRARPIPIVDKATANSTYADGQNASIVSSSPKRSEDDQSSPRKPTTGERPHSPFSPHKRSWLRTVLRTIFVDWIGGSVRWLFGRGRSQA